MHTVFNWCIEICWSLCLHKLNDIWCHVTSFTPTPHYDLSLGQPAVMSLDFTNACLVALVLMESYCPALWGQQQRVGSSMIDQQCNPLSGLFISSERWCGFTVHAKLTSGHLPLSDGASRSSPRLRQAQPAWKQHMLALRGAWDKLYNSSNLRVSSTMFLMPT